MNQNPKRGVKRDRLAETSIELRQGVQTSAIDIKIYADAAVTRAISVTNDLDQNLDRNKKAFEG